MTREEAIEELERLLRHWDLIDEGIYDLSEHDQDAVEIALSALRPVSREQVEKVWSWRGEWVGVPNMGVYDTACSKCGYCPGIRFWDSDFCPSCGAPMTDEAVEMVMERMETIR